MNNHYQIEQECERKQNPCISVHVSQSGALNVSGSSSALDMLNKAGDADMVGGVDSTLCYFLIYSFFLSKTISISVSVFLLVPFMFSLTLPLLISPSLSLTLSLSSRLSISVYPALTHSVHLFGFKGACAYCEKQGFSAPTISRYFSREGSC